jgi:hypothetical protein
MVEPSWHLGVYSWSIHYVRQRWDGFNTRVHTVRCEWAPAATSLRAKHLRLPLPEVPELAMFIHCGKPPDVFDRRPGSPPRVDKRGGMGRQVVKSLLPVLIIGWRSDGMDRSRG